MPPTALIPLLLLIPLFGGLLLTLLPRLAPASVRLFTLLITLISFVVSLALAIGYDWSAPAQPQFLTFVPWVQSFGLSFSFGLLDSVSLWLILLTTFLMPLVILGSWSAVPDRAREFHLWLLLLQAAMVGTFVATDIIFFYICFEFTLIPLYFLIGIFGSSQRLKAARVFFLYTFTGSMLTFAGVLYVAWFNASQLIGTYGGAGVWTFDMQVLITAAQRMSESQQFWVLLAMLAGFAVKVPLWPVHTWLPLAHTEAPTAGSVILAGVLLKLGTYGIFRLAIPMTPLAVLDLAPWVATLAVIGILYTALVCWVQEDLKKLIAYSSVSHLGFCVIGLFSMNVVGGTGSVMYMINHGLSTGALFLCVGMIYERLHTRDMNQMSGLAKVMPIWATFFVFFCLASVGLPGLNGFVSEFLCLLGAFDWRNGLLGPEFAVPAAVGMILGAIYILYMVGRVVFGPVKIPAHHDDHGHAAHAVGGHAAHGHADHHHAPLHDLNLREIITLVPLAVACLWLGLFPAPVLRSIDPAVAQMNKPVLTAQSQVENKVAQVNGASVDFANSKSEIRNSKFLSLDHSATSCPLSHRESRRPAVAGDRVRASFFPTTRPLDHFFTGGFSAPSPSGRGRGEGVFLPGHSIHSSNTQVLGRPEGGDLVLGLVNSKSEIRNSKFPALDHLTTRPLGHFHEEKSHP